MSEFYQSPALFPLTVVVGDQLDVGLTFTTSTTPPTAINLTGYAFESKIVTQTFANPDGGMGAGAYAVGATAATFTISAVNLAAGQINIGLTEIQTAGLSPSVGYRWFFRWTDTFGATLTVLSGPFTTRIP